MSRWWRSLQAEPFWLITLGLSMDQAFIMPEPSQQGYGNKGDPWHQSSELTPNLNGKDEGGPKEQKDSNQLVIEFG